MTVLLYVLARDLDDVAAAVPTDDFGSEGVVVELRIRSVSPFDLNIPASH